MIIIPYTSQFRSTTKCKFYPCDYVSFHDITYLEKKKKFKILIYRNFQLDSDGDGRLSFEEFRVLFENAERRKAAQEKSSVPTPPTQAKVFF